MTQRTLYISTAVIIALIQSGCAVYNPIADFTKQRYTNAISYFNTFYNAQRLFSDAEDEVLKSRRDFLEKGSSLKLFSIPASARQKFQTSIEKNSKVLSFYPDSKWVDDALLMIGKAYYYMEDDVRAERKFQELEAKFPNSGQINESQLWLGKSLMRQKKWDQAVKRLEDVFAKTIGHDDDLAGLAAYELAQYYFGLDNFEQAEKKYTIAVPLVDDHELRTLIYFQIGKCFSALQQTDKAIQSYSEAADISPIYTFKFQAQLQILKLLAQQKKFDESMNGLSAMLTDTKNTEYFGSVHFEIANVLMMQGKTAEAIVKYVYVDTAFSRSDVAARSYFILGKYYEEQLLNYDSARVQYGKARSEFAASEITKEATERSEIFNKYASLQKELQRLDSLMLSVLNAAMRNDSSAAVVRDSAKIKDTLIVKEEVKIKKMTKLGKQESKKDSIAVIDSSGIKDRLNRAAAQSTNIDSLQRSIIRTKFELAGLFYLEIQQPDSALLWFNDVVNRYPKSEFAPRAMYSIAEIYRSIKKRPASELDSLYRTIVNVYPESPYANEARKNIGIPVVVAERDSAQVLFEQAEALSDSNKYESAITLLKRIDEKFPASPVSPKALYSAGWYYENSLVNNDSAYAIYKRLIAKYPASSFVSTARVKVGEFDNEVKRIEQEKQQLIDAQKLKEQQEKDAKAAAEAKPAPVPVPSDSLKTPKRKL